VFLKVWLVTRFSGFVRCCYFSTSETCRKRNPEALSPAEMFALTQFGMLQSRSRVALPPDPGSSAAACSRFCPCAQRERVAAFEPEQTTHRGCTHTWTWGRSCSTTTHQPSGGIWVISPLRSPCASLKALYMLSTGCFSLSQSSGSPTNSLNPAPGGQDDPSMDFHCPKQLRGGSPRPEARQTGGVNHIHAAQACPTVLQTCSTYTFLLPVLLKQCSRARLKLVSVGKVLVLAC